jgi:hypothetical protein
MAIKLAKLGLDGFRSLIDFNLIVNFFRSLIKYFQIVIYRIPLGVDVESRERVEHI